MAATFTALLVILSFTLAAANEKGSPPRFEIPKDNKWETTIEYIKKGNEMTIPCIASGNPQPHYRWLYEDKVAGDMKVVKNSTEIYVSAEEGFLIATKQFTTTQDGKYSCVAYNKYGGAMTPPISLVTAVAPTFPGRNRLPSDIRSVYQSEYVKLECKGSKDLTGKPKSKIIWKRGKQIESVKRVMPKENIAIDPDGVLHFLWVDSDDIGFVYVCCAFNRKLLLENMNTRSYKLEERSTGQVAAREPEQVYARDVIAIAGTNTTLTCLFSYFSPTTEKLKITWRHKGDVVGEGQRLVLAAEVPTDQVDMSGEYTCEAALGSVKKLDVVRLTITSPPVFLPGQGLRYLTVAEDQEAVFRCGAVSYGTQQDPPVWFVNSEILNGQNERFDVSSDRITLSVHSVTLEDQMCIQCSVRNQYGVAFGSGCLTVLEKIKVLERPSPSYDRQPGSLLNLSVDATTDSRVQDQLGFEWIMFKSPGDTDQEFSRLPQSPNFNVSSLGKRLTMVVPDIRHDGTFKKDLSRANELKFAVNISHPYEFTVIHFAVYVQIPENDTVTDGESSANSKTPTNSAGVKRASFFSWPVTVPATIIYVLVSATELAGRMRRNN